MEITREVVTVFANPTVKQVQIDLSTERPAANSSAPRQLGRPSPAEAEAVQRAHALIQGSIREKGLSLREEHST
jgi:hypothetical protein